MNGQRLATGLLGLAFLMVGLGTPAVFAQSGDEAGDETAEKKAKSDQGEDESEGDEKEKKDNFNAHATLTRANKLAGRNALTRSIPVYEKVLEHAHDKYTSAHFNLAEVLRAKENYARALVHYQAYLMMGDDPATKDDAKRGIQKLKANVWDEKFATLSVDIEPEMESTISIDGFIVKKNGSIDEMEILAGEYTISADATDHHPDEKTVTVENEEAASVSFELKKKIFFGTATVSVNHDGATVKFHPEKLDNPRGPDEPVVREAPMDEPVELETGKWLVEVTKPEFHRWVRYVDIQRDEQEDVSVQLEKKLPEEIR